MSPSKQVGIENPHRTTFLWAILYESALWPVSVKYLLAIIISAVGCSLRLEDPIAWSFIWEQLLLTGQGSRSQRQVQGRECPHWWAPSLRESTRAECCNQVPGQPQAGQEICQGQGALSGGSEGTRTEAGLETWLQHMYEGFILDISNMQSGPKVHPGAELETSPAAASLGQGLEAWGPETGAGEPWKKY